MKRLVVLGIAFFFTAGAMRAQESYTIKLKELGEGESALIKKKENVTTKVKVSDADGNAVVDKNDSKIEVQEYKETIHKRQAGKSAIKLERDYSKAQIIQEGDTEDGPLHGKTVVIERMGDEYKFTYKNGAEVAGKALDVLSKDFSKKRENSAEIEKLVLPKGAVKAGETWKIDMAKVVEVLANQGGLEVDAAKSTGQGTLTKAYKKDGRQFGVMKFSMQIPVTSVGKGIEQLKFKAGAKITVDLTLDACIDGSTDAGTMSMKMILSGVAPVGVDMTASLDVVFDATQVEDELPKK